MPSSDRREGAPAGRTSPRCMGHLGPHGAVHMGHTMQKASLTAAECLVALRPVLSRLLEMHLGDPGLPPQMKLLLAKGHLVTCGWLQLLEEGLDTANEPDAAALALMQAQEAVNTNFLFDALVACQDPRRFSDPEAESRVSRN